MNNKPLITVSILISIEFTFLGCSHTENARTTTENSNCTTIIEGYFHVGTLYFGQSLDIKGPAICVKHGSEQQTFYGGDIVRIDNKGIVFWPKKDSPFYRPDSTFYSYDQVIWTVDKNNKLIIGELPKGDNG